MNDDLPERPTDLANNPGLLNALLGRWRTYLIVVARRQMGHRELRMWATAHDDDDIVQLALFRAARYVHNYDPARGTFVQFLCLQLRSAWVELYRLAARQRRSRRPAVGFGEPDCLTRRPDPRFPAPPAVAEANDFWAHAGRNLDADERALLRMRHREGLMCRQIAATLGVAEHVCFTRYQKVEAKLRAGGV